MKNLNEILNEGIFDKDLKTNDEFVVMRGWLDQYNIEPCDTTDPEIDIDGSSKIIKFIDSSYPKRSIMEISIRADKQAFDGFIPGWRFVDVDGDDITSWKLHGHIKGFKDAPAMESISVYADDAVIDSKAYKDISSQFKKLKEMYFYSRATIGTFNGLDLSELKTHIRLLYLGNIADGSEVRFNPDLKVETLQFGYGAIDASVKNLPIFKTLSFKSADFTSIHNMIDGLEDKGKSNFNSIQITCKDCNNEEKEAIKNLLKGEDTGFVGYGEILKKIEVINKVVNDNDGGKDRFGESLSPGDVVIVADTSSPKWPSFLDIYKGCSGNGRIRTEKRMQLPPRNVIKLNNPKILDLLK